VNSTKGPPSPREGVPSAPPPRCGGSQLAGRTAPLCWRSLARPWSSVAGARGASI
jgi:hypothetical protein